MESPAFYKELPANYKLVKTIDAKKFSTVLLFNVVGSLLLLASGAVGILLLSINHDLDEAFSIGSIIFLLLFLPIYIIYVILHELTHGIVYKYYTHEKLKFGFNFVVAFCGVPNIYVNKKVSTIAVLAPLVVYSVLFIGLTLLIPNVGVKLLMIVMFACHFAGCIGDIYVALYLAFKNRGKQMLINDTGPKQTFYVKVDEDGN